MDFQLVPIDKRVEIIKPPFPKASSIFTKPLTQPTEAELEKAKGILDVVPTHIRLCTLEWVQSLYLCCYYLEQNRKYLEILLKFICWHPRFTKRVLGTCGGVLGLIMAEEKGFYAFRFLGDLKLEQFSLDEFKTLDIVDHPIVGQDIPLKNIVYVAKRDYRTEFDILESLSIEFMAPKSAISMCEFIIYARGIRGFIKHKIYGKDSGRGYQSFQLRVDLFFGICCYLCFHGITFYLVAYNTQQENPIPLDPKSVFGPFTQVEATFLNPELRLLIAREGNSSFLQHKFEMLEPIPEPMEGPCQGRMGLEGHTSVELGQEPMKVSTKVIPPVFTAKGFTKGPEISLSQLQSLAVSMDTTRDKGSLPTDIREDIVKSDLVLQFPLTAKLNQKGLPFLSAEEELISSNSQKEIQPLINNIIKNRINHLLRFN